MSEFLWTRQVLWKMVAPGLDVSGKDPTQKEEGSLLFLIAKGRNCKKSECTASCRQWYKEG